LYFSRRFSRSSDRCPFFFSARKACYHYQHCFGSEMFIPDPTFLYPRSRTQGSKRHWIPDQDPQH
jgi:hypothetical protein